MFFNVGGVSCCLGEVGGALIEPQYHWCVFLRKPEQVGLPAHQCQSFLYARTHTHIYIPPQGGVLRLPPTSKKVNK